MKCIVTGGAGFIGSNVVELLLKSGHEVLIVDNFSTNKGNSPHEFVASLSNRPGYLGLESSGVLFDSQELKRLLVGFDTVFHLAAHPRVEPSIKQPMEYHRLNVDTTLNVFEAARLSGIKKVVFSSSSSIYGDPIEIPTKEEHVKDPMSPYGLHKQIGEEYAALYCKLYGMNITCLRYMNVYGPRQPEEGAYVPVIGIWFRQLRNKQKLTITGDGTQTRDFVHVEDVARANLSSCQPDVVGYQAFNIGSGTNYSLNEIARWMTTEDNIQYIEKRFEPHTTKADLAHVKSVLGWEPTHDLRNYINELITGL